MCLRIDPTRTSGTSSHFMFDGDEIPLCNDEIASLITSSHPSIPTKMQNALQRSSDAFRNSAGVNYLVNQVTTSSFSCSSVIFTLSNISLHRFLLSLDLELGADNILLLGGDDIAMNIKRRL